MGDDEVGKIAICKIGFFDNEDEEVPDRNHEDFQEYEVILMRTMMNMKKEMKSK